MREGLIGSAKTTIRRRARIVFVTTAVVAAAAPAAPQTRADDGRGRIEQAQREEGEAILGIADAVMTGKAVPADFQISWHNEFLKAQQGTFVPFTLTFDATKLVSRSALVYVRAAARGAAPPKRSGRKPTRRGSNKEEKQDLERTIDEAQYPVDAIFPIDFRSGPPGLTRVSRGFSVSPGAYDVFVVIRERVTAGGTNATPPTAVLRQKLDVPNFWSGELTTSSVIVADRLEVLPGPISAEELVERPYVIGQNDITPAADRRFGQDEELIVVLLVYNPTVTPEKKFDVQVEYHFFRRGGGAQAGAAASAVPHPPEQDGERYFNHTDPQRFNPAVMGAQFDPNAGYPVMAGQGIPLAGFERGDYRLAIRVTDLMSGKSITRDVDFTVGS